jgi:Rap guanine nucleotide exchange factor 1
LAILSALDSGPLKRLNWSKSIIDVRFFFVYFLSILFYSMQSISEHTGLIDSTGSFKNYREALNASIGQPCIPYM